LTVELSYVVSIIIVSASIIRPHRRTTYVCGVLLQTE